ncbi:MAG: hypothetical protein HETSPECPRED_005614 [Heterodermia speciosa]|uniref:Uncharacterized protein n=1 Tax=Heterodermia speciosa TaxID=116794 RepID=A0A8H3FHA0_9LECA|nr:MAG: hypothetical protein HETSPECPRED_005614 [Heterodermia speciosa]
MARNAEHRKPERKAVNEGEAYLNADDGVNEASEDAASKDSVLFDQLGEIVQKAQQELLSFKSSPMARVRKEKPSSIPKYPTRGSIHMV